MGGVHGSYLRVDPRPGRTEVVPLAEAVLRRFLGGVGLGTWLFAHESAAGVDPLGPESPLVFAFSPLVGSPLTTSAKFAVVGLSPLTGRLCDALCSSQFAIAGKRLGVDAVVVSGACDRPTVVRIDGSSRFPKVFWEPAEALWGQTASETERRLRERFGGGWQIAAIGPAGERRIPFATISHDGRHAGRGGLGAVMGAKRIKAVMVRGVHRTRLSDPEATLALARDLSARSFGPATAKYREVGTIANLLAFNRLEALPSRNFAERSFAGADALTGVDLGPSRRIARQSCASCTIGCEHVFEARDRGEGVRLEYESLFAMGPLCGVEDAEAVVRAVALCDDLGLDTISTGATIAFAMESVERGWLDGRLPRSGRRLRFGDGVSLVEAIQALHDREGALGELLARGSRRAAERIGGEAPRIAPHVKGLELPGYHPVAAARDGAGIGRRNPRGPTTTDRERMRRTSRREPATWPIRGRPPPPRSRPKTAPRCSTR